MSFNPTTLVEIAVYMWTEIHVSSTTGTVRLQLSFVNLLLWQEHTAPQRPLIVLELRPLDPVRHANHKATHLTPPTDVQCNKHNIQHEDEGLFLGWSEESMFIYWTCHLWLIVFCQQLYYSSNFGFSWTLKDENVRSYYW